jgi:hypothetical protein
MRAIAVLLFTLVSALAGLAQTAGIAVSIFGSPDPVMPGTSLVYEIVVENRGSEPATDTVLAVVYDRAFGFRAASPAPDSGTDDVWTLGTIAPGGRAVVLVTGFVDAAASEKLGIVAFVRASTSAGEVTGQASLDTDVLVVVPQVVYVRQGEPAPLQLATATGRDLDKYTFAVLRGPQNGSLQGTPPNLLYVPKKGFTGTDEVIFYTADPRGEKTLGNIWIVVLSKEEEMSPPGFGYTGELAFSGPGFTVESWLFKPTLFLHLPYFDQTVKGIWTLDEGFTSFSSDTSLKLRGDFPSDWTMPITMSVKFDPEVPAFKSASLKAYTTISGIYLGWYFYLAGDEPQTNSYSTFQLKWKAGDISFSSYTRFITLSPSLGEERLTISGRYPYDDSYLRWGASLSFTKGAGFNNAVFTLQDIPIPCELCKLFSLYLDLKATFSVSDKTIAPSLRLVSGFTGCVQPLVEYMSPTSGFGIEGIKVYGVRIRCDLPGGQRLILASSFDPDPDHLYNCRVTGYCDFFETARLEGPIFPCCGNPGWWETAFYFQPPELVPDRLFGLALSHFSLWFPITKEITWHFALDVGLVDPDDPSVTYRVTVGWRGLW